MKTKLILIFLVSVFALTQSAYAEKAVAVLKGTADPSIAGTVEFEEAQNGVTVKGTISGISPGEHGFHVHENGSCGDLGNAAGGHFNPDKNPHGLTAADGISHVHAGDLGNISVNKDLKGNYHAMVPGLTLKPGKYNITGRAVIVHEKQDDFGQPTGNAGGRIACGIIEVKSK